MHGARTEGVPFARPGSEFTRDFECLVSWLAARTDKSTIKRMLRIDWDTVGRIVKRVCDDELDPDRLDDLYDIGIDETSWERQHNYLTLIADHQRCQVVWGCEVSYGADHKFLICVANHHTGGIVWATEGRNSASLQAFFDQLSDEQKASIRAVSIDMSAGYEKAIRAPEGLPDAQVCFDPYHVVHVRHEALSIRAGCETPPPGCRGSPVKLRAV